MTQHSAPAATDPNRSAVGGCVRAQAPRPARHQRGFNLVELIVAVVLVGVLAAIGIPSFQALTQSTEARDGVESLASGFMSARATAVNTGVSVKICAVAAGGSGCSASPADWATAWTVFEDCDDDNDIDDDPVSDAAVCTAANSNQVGASTAAETVFARGSANDATWTITDANGAAGPVVFTFSPSGRVAASTPDWPVTFQVAGKDGGKYNRLVVSRLGQVCVELRESGECS